MKNSNKKDLNFLIRLAESDFMTKLMIFLFIVLFALIIFILLTQNSSDYGENSTNTYFKKETRKH